MGVTGASRRGLAWAMVFEVFAAPVAAQGVRTEPIELGALSALSPVMTVGRTLRGVLVGSGRTLLWLRTSDGLVRVSREGYERVLAGPDLVLPDAAPAPGWLVVGAGGRASGIASRAAQLRFVDPVAQGASLALPSGIDRVHASPDGRVVAVASLTGAQVYASPTTPSGAWTRRAVLRFPVVPELTALSPDGAQLATSSGRAVTLFDAVRGARVSAWSPPPSWCPSTRETCPDHRGPPDTRWMALCIAPDGAVRAAGGTRVAAAPDAHRLDVFTGGTGARPLADLVGTLQRAQFSPDCARLAVTVLDGQGAASLAVYAVADGAMLGQTLLATPAPQFGWSPDGSTLAVADASTVTIWDVNTGESAVALPDGAVGGMLDAQGQPCGAELVAPAARAWLQSAVLGPVRWTGLSPTGQDPNLVRGSLDGRVAVRQRGVTLSVFGFAGSAPQSLPLPFRPAAMAVTPDGSAVAVSRADGVVEVRALPRGEIRQTLRADAASVRLTWSRDGGLLAGVDARRTLRVWRVEGGSVLATRTLNDRVAVIPGPTPGGFVVDDLSHAIVWSPAEGSAHEIPFSLRATDLASRSADGSLVCGVARGRGGVVLRIANGEAVATASAARACALSASGSLVAWISGGAAVARVHAVGAPAAEALSVPIPPFTREVALSPDGALLATSDGATVTLRGLRGTGAPRTLSPSVRVDALAFSPDGSLLVLLTRGALAGSLEVAEVWAVPETTAPGWTPSSPRV